MQDSSISIRVYGIWIRNNQEILLTDERMGNVHFTKFPGGGLEIGEGTLTCLHREWKEELGIEIEILQHFYTTDFYQASAFHINTQIISIYYLVAPKTFPKIAFQSQPFAFGNKGYEEVLFRWHSLKNLNEESVTLPIDKHVVKLLKRQFDN